MKVTPENAQILANAILMEMDCKELDPVLSYAALGDAFIRLHIALGHDKKDWLETTKEMADIANWEENES